jgi:hypothetical protein
MSDFRIALQLAGVTFKQSPNDSAEIKLCCLFCQERGYGQDYRFRLGVNTSNGKAQCFNCKWKSRHGPEYIAKRLQLGDIALPTKGKEKAVKEARLPKDFEVLKGRQTDYWAKVAKDYITERGVTEKQIREHKIGVSFVGRYNYRIIFPVYYEGSLKGIVARSFTAKEPRYLNSHGAKAIYGLQDKRMYRPILVISEGILKSLAIERALPDVLSVSLLGHTMTDQQADMLLKNHSWKEICLWPDPDMAGIRGFIQIAEQLSLRHKVTIPWPPPKQQADELFSGEIKLAFRDRQPFNQKLILAWQYKPVEKRY